jgi:hypothetical protein
MIEIYRHAQCEPCAGVEAHQVIVVSDGEPAPGAVTGPPLPAIVDRERVVSGEGELAA